MNTLNWLLGGLLVGLCSTAQAAPAYWSDTWRGWHFYEAPRPPPKPPPEPVAPSQPAELVAFKHLQQTLEDYKNIAIMRPTFFNVRRYMTLEAQVTARASAFADMAQRIAWSNPELDPTLRGRPVNAQALEVFEAMQQNQRFEQVAQLSKDHVLLFFYRSDCPYCHTFAPTLLALQKRLNLQVEAVSLDGGALPGFPKFRHDNGISRTCRSAKCPPCI